MKPLIAILAASVLMLGLAACGDDDDVTSTNTPGATTHTTAPAASTPAASSGATTVGVTLQDYEITLDSPPDSAGSVAFDISNHGPSVHEFVVVKTDLAATDLPKLADGSVDEDSDQLTAVDEAEDVPVDGTASFSANLDAGHYVFFCNIVEEEGGSTIAHYTNGMRGEFTIQ